MRTLVALALVLAGCGGKILVADASPDSAPDAGTHAPGSCDYNGHWYPPGASFTADDGVNACSCDVQIGLECSAVGSDTPDANTCAALGSEAGADVIAATQKWFACDEDSDCTVMDLQGTCFGACAYAINKRGVGDVTAAEISAQSTSACQSFDRQSCGNFAPACATPSAPRCTNNRCQLQ